jgi:peptidoglycan L-alanyl-D-glutamate endopeptidase CwlK
MKFKPYGFAESSVKRLEGVHEDLQIIFNEVKKYCMIDFDISCGHRTKQQQVALYTANKSKIDGISQKSKHQLYPSEAIDIYAYKEDGKGSYTIHQMTYIAAVVQSVAIQLYSRGTIDHIIRWGGNWDSDGYIIDDQSFQDLCHFELMEV